MSSIPTSFESERLLIRAPEIGDALEINAAVLETFDELHQWMPWAQTPPTLEQSREYERSSISDFAERKELTLRIYLKGTGTLVGSSGFCRMNWDIPSAEIGYWCRKRFVGQGYITEAVRRITQVGFAELGFKRLEIRCDSRNLRSRRVAERAGYTLEGELRNERLGADGKLTNTLIFARIPGQS